MAELMSKRRRIRFGVNMTGSVPDNFIVCSYVFGLCVFLFLRRITEKFKIYFRKTRRAERYC